MPVDNEESTWMKSSPAQTHLQNGVPTSSIPMQTLGGTRRVMPYLSRSASAWWPHVWWSNYDYYLPILC